MKKSAQSLILSFLSFAAVAYFYPGFSYQENVVILFLAAGAFAILTIFVKPIIKLLSLPFNLITFGLFSFLINVIIIYAVSFFVHDFSVQSWHFAGASFSGFNLPATDLTQLVSALVASIIISLISTILHFVFH